MSTCCWCTPGGSFTTEFLRKYSSKNLSSEDLAAANDDLCYCLECVFEYHKARNELAFLHKNLWELETSRLVVQFEKALSEDSDDEDELLLVEEDRETRLSGYTGPDFENSLRVPLLEILKYPYLLLHERVGELCVAALCKMEQVNYSFQVFDKHPGIYLFLVHPTETIRRWAILTARTLGKVDRDDFYDLQEVFTCLLKVIELGLFENPDIYSFSEIEKGKLIILPPHLYDTNNYKNYWLGICMLLSVLEEQAMDSLLLGPDKQNDFMHSILNTMGKKTDDDNINPFWPALHCFMVILDQLGSKVWGQLIDPIEAFQIIISSPSYKNEIENIRRNTIRTKSEPESDYNDDTVSCSQIVYNYNTEKTKKDAGWKSAICPDYCPNMYEEMQTLASVLQSDIGQDMRVHNSTFLWFIPFVQSVMDLKDLGVAYIVEVIHHLHSEIKDVLNRRVELCDQVTEFFILILVSVIELHRNKKCLHLLWVSSQKWVEALVKCAVLPTKDFRRHSDKVPTHCSKITSTTSLTVPTSVNLQATNSVQYACIQLIRSLLREGCQIGQQSTCKKFLDVFNHLLRSSSIQGLNYIEQETESLESCLKQVIKNIKDRMSVTVSSPVEDNSGYKVPSTSFIKQENVNTDDYRMETSCRNSFSPRLPSEIGTNEVCQKNLYAGRKMSLQECPSKTDSKDSKLCPEAEHCIVQGDSGVSRSFEKQEVSDNFVTSRNRDFCNNGQHEPSKEAVAENRSLSDGHFISHQESASTYQNLQEGRNKERECESDSLSTDLRGNHHGTQWDGEGPRTSPSKYLIDSTKIKNFKTKLNVSSWQSKLSMVMNKSKTCLKNKRTNDTSDPGTQSNQSKSVEVCPAGNHGKDQISSALCNTTTSEVGVQKNSENGDKSINKILSVSLHPLKLESDSLLNFSRSCTKLSNTEKIHKSDNGDSDSDDSVSLAVIRNTLLRKKCSDRSSNLPESLGNKDLEKLTLDLEQAKLESLSPKKDVIRDGTRSSPAFTRSDSAPNNSAFMHQKCKNKALRMDPISMKGQLDVTSESSDDLPVATESALAKKKDSLIVSPCILMPFDVDKGLDKLSSIAYVKGMNFPKDSSPDTSVSLLPDQIERKVKVDGKSSVNDQSNCSSSNIKTFNEPIIISDSSDEERMHTTINDKREYPVEQPLTSGCTSVSLERNVKDEIKLKHESSPVPCEEYDSQFFEFETENEVYSVWKDSQDTKTMSDIQKQEQGLCSSSSSAQDCSKEHLDLENQYNEWGYETDYISDDVIEEAVNAAEKLASKGKASVNKMLNESELYLERGFCKESEAHGHSVHSFYHKMSSQSKYKTVAEVTAESRTNEMAPKKHKEVGYKLTNASKLTKKKKRDVACSEQKDLVEAKPVRTGLKSPQKVNKIGRSNKMHANQASAQQTVPLRTLPAVIPPKKDRKCPEPTSTVEKLGLKKAPRKAFDLSQRTLDSLAELRSHGQAAGALEINRKQKNNLIAPLALSVKGNKNLLACQDLQFYRQTRPKKRVKEKNPGKASKNMTKRVKSTVAEKPPRQETVACELPLSTETWEHRTELTTPELVPNSSSEGKKLRKNTLKKHDNKGANVSVSENNMAPIALNINMQDKNKMGGSLNDSLYFSLPLCHAHEEEKNELNEENKTDYLFLTQLSPVDMELCSQEENLDIEMGTDNDTLDTAESIPRTLSSGAPQCKEKDCTQVAELPDIYCCKHSKLGTSDDQHFVRPGLPPSLLKAQRPSTVKIFSPSISSRNASFTKDLENRSKLPAVKNKPQPMAPKLNEPILTSAQSRIMKPLMDRANIAQYSRSEAESAPFGPGGHQISSSCRVNPASIQPCDQAFLIREILQWKYEMFSNFYHFGASCNVCQFDLTTVPYRFHDHKNYFHVFFPLMMLNTFESLVQEWKDRKNTHYELHRCSNIHVNPADYKVFIRDCDLKKQHHPKEDDLVFLWDQDNQNSFSPNQGELENPLKYYIGYVSRFGRTAVNEMRSREQYIACHLSIQIQGNCSSNSQKVSCEVIGNLVTTRRQFKALLQLLRSPLFKPIINPSPADFYPRDKINVPTEGRALSYMSEYNEDQIKAIETALAIVKQHPKLPRICLIHGPPGTGKSKTIVGLLHRILIEKHGHEMLAQNLNTKNKRSRVLVCAPSNAAIDDLMKKIILEFKSKCQDKNNTLGNCGDINLVRLGSEKTIDKMVVKFSLDYQVNRRMEKTQPGHYQDFQARKEELDCLLDALSRQQAIERRNKSKQCEILDEKICKLSRERQQLTCKQKEVRPYQIQRTIILESHIICCTLNTSGGFLLESAFRQLGSDPFSCVIVDEAGQACEVETLIPLIHRCSKLILVGDPEQLPPTVISKKAESFGYGKSLMARLCSSLDDQVQLGIGARKPVLQLTVQYRMHPDICLFPSNYIYGKLLKTNKDTEQNRCSSSWPFQSYLLFDVLDGYERRENESYCNPQEVKLTMAIIKVIKEKRKDMKGCSFGIITPYKAQKNMILNELEKAFGANSDMWQVDTVDGFQGREKDCVIVTCVRANAASGCIGFLDSRQRLNVTITRAKFSLFILGSLKTLVENQDWNSLIQDAQRRGAIIKTGEQDYRKHASYIQKRSLSYSNNAGLESRVSRVRSWPQGENAHSTTSEFLNDLKRLSALPLSPAASQPPSSVPRNGDPQPQSGDPGKILVQPKVSNTAPVQTALPPAPPERLRDPRLARREETVNKEHAGKINQGPSCLGVRVPQDISAVATHLGHGTALQQHLNSEASIFNKLVQTFRPDYTMSSLTTKISQSPGEGNNQNRHYHSAIKKPSDEPLDRHDVKKRKMSI